MKYRLLLIIIVALFAVLPAQAQEANLLDACVTDYDATVDYFPEKVTKEHATGFTVEYFANYKVVTVNTPWQDAEAPLQYVLVQCGTPAPEGFGDALVIDVPVPTIVAMSTSFLPHLTQQGLLDRLIAIDTALYTSNDEVLARVAADAISEIGGGGSGQEVNVEALIDLEPALVMTQRFSSADTTYPVLQEAGLPVVINADFLDSSPLGLAEWGKFISLFFNTEALAQEQFAGVSERYAALKAAAADATSQPTVFAGTPFDGTWYMPGGGSYLGQLLADANAAYLWADDPATGSLFLDFETVFDRAVDAEFWVNVNPFWGTLADAEAEDARYANFAAFQNATVYSNNARVNANGGSDYFESGYANPDIILADLVKIFHPDLLPDHTLYFYAQVPPAQ
ncbi:MAG: ABC transporter substrate-binding protein [Anaerolineae bacterium]|nr:ABC transporter substrate-binding protein [Anaerolineae bacterium]